MRLTSSNFTNGVHGGKRHEAFVKIEDVSLFRSSDNDRVQVRGCSPHARGDGPVVAGSTTVLL